MSDDDSRFTVGALRCDMPLDVDDEALHGSADIEIVHAGGADAGKFRSTVGAACSLFGRGDNGSDGSSPKAARTESERFIESVVEFVPFAMFGKFGDGCCGDGAGGSGEEEINVGAGGGQELPCRNGVLKQSIQLFHGRIRLAHFF